MATAKGATSPSGADPRSITDDASFIELLEVLDLEPVPGSRRAVARRAAPANADGHPRSQVGPAATPERQPTVFRGRSPAGRTRAIFGGQLVAQALIAAGRTVEPGRVPHSLHAYFLRAGDSTEPLEFHIEAVRDGRNYQHRQVITVQDGREVFRLLAGFTTPQPGPHYEQALPSAGGTDPTTLPDYIGWTMDGSDNPDHPWASEPSPVQVRFEAPPPQRGQVVDGRLRLWLRLRGQIPSDEPLLHAALLAWMSDKTLADLTVLVHGRRWVDEGVTSLSLDHAMWFFPPARADGWLAFDQEVEVSSGGRGFVRGSLITPTGRRVATAAQEAVVGLPD